MYVIRTLLKVKVGSLCVFFMCFLSRIISVAILIVLVLMAAVLRASGCR